MKNPFKRLFFFSICLWNFLVLLSAAHEHSLRDVLNQWKRLKLTMEGDLNSFPTSRKGEVYLEESVTIAECTGQFELALEVMYWDSLCLQLYDYRIISLCLDERQHRAVACGLMGRAAASGSDSCRDPVELQSQLLAEVPSGPYTSITGKSVHLKSCLLLMKCKLEFALVWRWDFCSAVCVCVSHVEWKCWQPGTIGFSYCLETHILSFSFLIEWLLNQGGWFSVLSGLCNLDVIYCN